MCKTIMQLAFMDLCGQLKRQATESRLPGVCRRATVTLCEFKARGTAGTVRGAAGQAGDEVEQRTMLAALPATLLADL